MNTQKNNFKPLCRIHPTNCITDTDCIDTCSESQTGTSFTCSTIHDNRRICAPKKAQLQCNAKYGGVPVWTEWSFIDNMNWDCLCNYPEWSNTKYCQKLNAGICTGGIFNWDATIENPDTIQCICPNGMQLMKDQRSGIPRCIPSSIENIYKNNTKPIEYMGCYKFSDIQNQLKTNKLNLIGPRNWSAFTGAGEFFEDINQQYPKVKQKGMIIFTQITKTNILNGLPAYLLESQIIFSNRLSDNLTVNEDNYVYSGFKLPMRGNEDLCVVYHLNYGLYKK